MGVAAAQIDFAQCVKPSFLDVRYSFRFTLYQQKPYPRASASDILEAIRYQASKGKASKLRSGVTGIYLSVYPEWDGQKWIWPVLDIDGADKDPVSAIQRAQALYGLLWEMGLAHDFQWGLSGTGIRAFAYFLIPYELRGGLIRWLKSLAEYGVDPGPFDGVDPAPVRLLCHRGHKNQMSRGDKPLDRHSVLIDVETLLSIESLADYEHFTNGKPDPQEYATWLEDIFPVAAYDGNGNTPAAIRAFLDLLTEQTILSEIEHNIFRDFEFPSSYSATYELDREKLLQHLDSLGIEQWPRDFFYVLSRCPECGRSRKAWITRGGTLKCFSTNCKAFRGTRGLKVREWAGEGFFSAIEQEPKAVKFVDLCIAENMIIDHLAKPSPNKALSCTPGTGKTLLAIKFAADVARSSFVVYAMPNHRLINSTMEHLWAEVPTLHLRGRGALAEDKGKMCLNYDEVKSAVAKGYFPAQTVCLRCQYSPKQVKRRAYKSFSCQYYQQFEELKSYGRGLIFCTTHGLPYLFGGEIPIQSAFIDEQAVFAMVHTSLPVSVDELQTLKPFIPENDAAVLDRIERAAQNIQRLTVETNGTIARLYSAQPGGGLWRGKTDLWKTAGISKQDAAKALYQHITYLMDSYPMDLYGAGINYNALRWLATAIGDGIAWVHVNVRNAEGHLKFEQMIRHMLPSKMGLTVLDATASRTELTALFQREFDITEVNVSWEGQRVFLHQGMGKKKTKLMPAEKIEAYLRAMIEYLPMETTKALLVTHQHCEEAVKAILKKLRPEVEWSSLHYWASRGLNDFEQSEAVLCFGVPVASPGATADIAATLFPDNVDEQNKWLREQNENELYQAVHRARFVRNPGRTLIVMGHYWPSHLLGEPDFTDDRRRNQTSERPKQVLDRALAIVDILGFFTKETAAWAGIGAKRDEVKIKETRAAALSIFREIEVRSEETGRPSFIKDILIELGAPVRPLIRVGTPEFDTNLLSTHDHFWTNLLTDIQLHRPGIGRLSVLHPSWGNRNWTRAVGSTATAQKWQETFKAAAKLLGYDFPDFNPAVWKEGWD